MRLCHLASRKGARSAGTRQQSRPHDDRGTTAAGNCEYTARRRQYRGVPDRPAIGERSPQPLRLRRARCGPRCPLAQVSQRAVPRLDGSQRQKFERLRDGRSLHSPQPVDVLGSRSKSIARPLIAGTEPQWPQHRRLSYSRHARWRIILPI